MPIKEQSPKGLIFIYAMDLFKNHEDHYPITHGSRVFVDDEPNGQETLDTGELVPIFEALVTNGPEKGMIIQVAREELIQATEEIIPERSKHV